MPEDNCRIGFYNHIKEIWKTPGKTCTKLENSAQNVKLFNSPEKNKLVKCF